MNTVFVILHYLTINDTLEAVESIKNYEPESQIVIVDNASGNGTYEKLLKKFKDDVQVDVILTPENLGFAKGNNYGIDHARKQYNPDFICLSNNDVLLLESITESIQKEYEKSDFAVLGPMIYTADGRCDDNPGVNKPMTKSELQNTIRYLNRMVTVNKLHIESLYRVLSKIKRKLIHDQVEINHKPYLMRLENVQLHGSFLVLSRNFFENFQGLYPETFLNMEEDILFWQLMQKNLVSVYLPDIHIFHKEDSASKKVWPKERNRALAKTKNCLDSALAFERLMLSSRGKGREKNRKPKEHIDNKTNTNVGGVVHSPRYHKVSWTYPCNFNFDERWIA